jgi:hypothetical protein
MSTKKGRVVGILAFLCLSLGQSATMMVKPRSGPSDQPLQSLVQDLITVNHREDQHVRDHVSKAQILAQSPEQR